MTNALDRCSTCGNGFKLPPIQGFLVTPCCFKIFHTSCVEGWIKKSLKCPACVQTLDPSKAGKTIEVIGRVFQIAISETPNDVRAVFKIGTSPGTTPFEPDLECPTCTFCYPLTGITYNPVTCSFSHAICNLPDSELQSVTLSQFAWLAKKLVGQYPELKAKFS